jgi:exonuclease SbcC
MIPISLKVSGFLSYCDPVELDFTQFDLACIAGANGAGKSSLLDAITWVLFGQARKRDDSVINAQASAAEVRLIFAYEGNIYRVQRSKAREKTTLLEFHILQDSVGRIGNLVAVGLSGGYSPSAQDQWKPLTEATMRESELRIQQTLRLDYDTFVNASFFLQGKADQFTQQRPGDRKRILSSILGLEIWESYRQGAADRRREVDEGINRLDGQLREINKELGEEDTRRTRLSQLDADLKRLSSQRSDQESILAAIRSQASQLAELQKLVDSLGGYLDTSRRRQEETQNRLSERRQEADAYASILARADEIQQAHAAWLEQRAELERLEEVAGRFREQEGRRAGPREEIQAACARLEQELLILQGQAQEAQQAAAQLMSLRAELEAVREREVQLERDLDRRSEIDKQLQDLRDRWLEINTVNQGIKTEQKQIAERLDRLAQVEGAVCPLCGQPLDQDDRLALIASLELQKAGIGEQYQGNLERLKELESQANEIKSLEASLTTVDADLRAQTQLVGQIGSRLELLANQESGWQSGGAIRLQEVQASLENKSYALEARTRLAEIDAELLAIGYDPYVHETARHAEQAGRAAETHMGELRAAQAALGPLQREIDQLVQELNSLGVEIAKQQVDYDQAAADFAVAQGSAPDLDAAEELWRHLQEEENRLRREVGAAEQRVSVLEDLKNRQKLLDAERQELSRQSGLYKQLERAFGKDGVPALLIEQALPQIETRANELLDRLSNGNMTVRFVTQSAYKDKRREDLKETLDIQISDSNGTRDYEMFSGGEAFRVNFAIRLALSEVLAQRAGARLQTLVIDEGFGSQDAQGRQRLIEAINLVRSDFAKVLVITHIDELKDAFPNRIEVEKTDRGSTLRVY